MIRLTHIINTFLLHFNIKKEKGLEEEKKNKERKTKQKKCADYIYAPLSLVHSCIIFVFDDALKNGRKPIHFYPYHWSGKQNWRTEIRSEGDAFFIVFLHSLLPTQNHAMFELTKISGKNRESGW
jgi:hypothetical protein